MQDAGFRSDTAMMEFTDWIGREERVEDVVTKAGIARFHATIGGQARDTALPGFHWCICTPCTPVEDLQEDGHTRLGGFMPPLTLPRRMWASSTIDFLAPIQLGARIERISAIASVKEKSGRTGPLGFVEIDHSFRSEGVEILREHQTIVYRSAAEISLGAPETKDIDHNGWKGLSCIVPDERLLFRYSALTFNTHRIHYDHLYTREVERYPTLIVHGPLIATLLLNLAADEIGPGKFSRVTIRAVSPAYVGQPLHLTKRSEGDQLILRAIGNDGRTVMDAVADLAN